MARGEGWLTRSTGLLMIIALDPVLKYTPGDLRRHGLDIYMVDKGAKFMGFGANSAGFHTSFDLNWPLG